MTHSAYVFCELLPDSVQQPRGTVLFHGREKDRKERLDQPASRLTGPSFSSLFPLSLPNFLHFSESQEPSCSNVSPEHKFHLIWVSLSCRQQITCS